MRSALTCSRIDGLVATEAVQLVIPGSEASADLMPEQMAGGLIGMVEHPGHVHGRVLTLDDLRARGAI